MSPAKSQPGLADEEETLQAVVMADSFDEKFRPITETLPRCLLPVAQRPLLSYALECLRSSGVREAFVYCSSHAGLIKSYLQQADWLDADDADGGDNGDANAGAMSVTVLTNEDCRSFGDAMRDLDAQGVLRKDFVLIRGDTVANVNLAPFVQRHKDRVQADKNASMTLVYKQAGPGHHCRTLEEEVVLATNGQPGRVLFHQRTLGKKVDLPLEIFDANEEVNLCYDLMDPGLAICAPSIPLLFADNFDCQTLDQFVKSVLEDDLIDNTIYVDEIREEGYAARVANLHAYSAVNLDVLSRWMYPLAPDMPVLGGRRRWRAAKSAGAAAEAKYLFYRNNVYKCRDLIMKRGSNLERDVILGPGCSVGENSAVSRSSVGARCQLGANVRLRDCILLDGVSIGENCHVSGCVLGPGVSVGADSTVKPRCVLGAGVAVNRGSVLPEGTRLIGHPMEDDDFSADDEDKDDGDAAAPSALNTFGPKAFRFEEDDDSDSEDDDGDGDDDKEAAKLRRDPWGKTLEDVQDDSSSSDDSEFSEMDDTMPDILLDEDAKYSVFHSEVLESLQRGAKEGVKADNLILEVNSSRHAYAVTASMVVQSVTVSILTIAAAAALDGDVGPAKLFKEVQRAVTQFKDILLKYCKTTSAQVDCLSAVEQQCRDQPDLFLPVAMKTIHHIYNLDVVAEDAVFEWFRDDSKFPDFARTMRQKVKAFVTWLQEADSDSDSDEEDSD